MQLRYYQTEAIEAAWTSLKNQQNPVISLPTGSGKALVLSELARRVLNKGGRVLVATHVQELVAQNAAEFQSLTGIEPGILCAGLERSDKGHDVLFASVQSLYGPAQRGEIPPFDLIQIDECHLVQDVDSDAKFYPTLFKCFPTAQRLGLSATPFRTDGPVYGDGKYFTNKCYEVSVLQLVNDGFLSPLIGVNSDIQLDTGDLKKIAGDFDQREVENLETDAWLSAVVASVKQLAEGRKYIAVFCPTVSTADRVSAIFNESGLGSKFVVADTEDRFGVITDWKAGKFPVLCSVNILSTGFNFPALDCIVCLRPTESLGLWVQILGRGTRKAVGKKNCLLLDYSGNLMIHGGICGGAEDVYDQKPSGEFEAVATGPRPKPSKRKIKTNKELLALDPMLASPKGFTAKVRDVTFMVIGSKAQVGKKLVMLTYDCETEHGLRVKGSSFLCTEYAGYAYDQAVKWFNRRGVDSFPRRADDVQMFCYGLPIPREVTLKKNGKYINVISERF